MIPKLPRGWVPEEKFLEHLKLFPMPCIDLLIEVVGKGIIWSERIIDPMKGKKVIFGARVLRNDKNFEQAVKRIALEETSLNVEFKDLTFVEQQIVEFKEKKDGVSRLDVVTCWAIKVSDPKKIQLNKKYYSEDFEITYEIPKNAGDMYVRDVESYLRSRRDLNPQPYR